ncbi:ScbA/BarX family gamma-butyrolactone biosynthesis protein [Streptomyces sp. NPDC049555]|uniref:ScbA/BarX family gamma-butyrolactone biosynthesis protein n=1 Tax=Streptomyces sp. NPDC049555 TaxID=3154930 RepID=UPI0034124F43
MPDVTLEPPATVEAQSSTPPPHALLGAYAHLRRPESLLVTDWEPTGAHEFALAVRWPAAGGPLPYDPRVLAQTVRQTGLVVAHGAYGVPLTHQTMLNALEFTVAPDLRAADRPCALAVEVTVAEPADSRSSARSLRMGFHILRDGVTAARAHSEFRWIAPRVYARVRGSHATVDWGSWPLPEPIPAGLAGRASAADVVLAPGDAPHRWLLRNDTANTALFDHPVDHVPGLALLEAADQAAHALLAPDSPVTLRIAASYRKYVEFDRPCWIEATPLPAAAPGRYAVRVTGTQDGEETFAVDFSGVKGS